MAATRFYLKTWACNTCEYQQDGDPNDASFVSDNFWTNRNIINRYGSDIAPTLPLGVCPHCFYVNGVSNPLAYVTDTAKMMVAEVMDPNDVATLQVPDTNAQGDTIMVESGKYNVQVVDLDTNNQPIYQKEPIMVPQLRYLTTEEQTAAQQQIQDDCNRLSAICYSRESL